MSEGLEVLYDAKLDPTLEKGYIDTDETRKRTLQDGRVISYRYQHGGFEGTDIRFSFCFPEAKEDYKERFFQYLSPFPGPQEELASLPVEGPNDKVGFALTHGAGYIESNMGSKMAFANSPDRTMTHRSSALTAEFCRGQAQKVYGYEHYAYVYVYGGSGGGYRTIACMENTVNFDGAAPHVIGSPYAIPNCQSTRAHAERLLRNKMAQVIDARGEGLMYAKWLKEHEGDFDGVIFSMPIFADENGAIAALQDAGVPILLQAYPDEIGKMDFAHRRDAYCGKFSVTDVFTQYGVPFTVMKPHVFHPLSDAFAQNLKDFAAVCRVVNGMKRFNIGCIGARTTAFKTVRFDETALQKYGINTETFDLAELIWNVEHMADEEEKVVARVERLENYTDFSRVPERNKRTLAKISVVIDEYIEEYHLDCLTLRCWNELETYLRVCPCVLLSELNDRGIVASCEIDLCSALNMRAMSLASGQPSAVLDWNNNYGDDENKVILFHCGPVAQSLMTQKGTVTEHKMFAKSDPGSGWGCNEGRIRAFDATISNCQTKDGRIIAYASEAAFTEDELEEGYFGCAGGFPTRSGKSGLPGSRAFVRTRCTAFRK